jgi:hypothetical protein
LLFELKSSQQQVFATTHSAAVIRELDVTKEELWVCKRDSACSVTVKFAAMCSGLSQRKDERARKNKFTMTPNFIPHSIALPTCRDTVRRIVAVRLAALWLAPLSRYRS